MLHGKRRFPCREGAPRRLPRRPQPVPAALPCPPFGIHFLSLKPGKGVSRRGVSGSLFPGSLCGNSYARCWSASGLLSFCTCPHPSSCPSAKPQSCSLQPPRQPADSFLGSGAWLVGLVPNVCILSSPGSECGCSGKHEAQLWPWGPQRWQFLPPTLEGRSCAMQVPMSPVREPPPGAGRAEHWRSTRTDTHGSGRGRGLKRHSTRVTSRAREG